MRCVKPKLDFFNSRDSLPKIMSFQTCMTFFILRNRYLNQKQMLLYYIQLNYASVVIIHNHRCDLYYDTEY